MRPSYVVIGEQKSGTGWLRDRLREHPKVFCHLQEVNFFNDRRNYARGLAWYCGILSGGPGAVAIGEKSPDYFWLDRGSARYFDNPLENIARDLPSAKIVLCLRNPVERAISAFHHHLYQRGRRIHPQLVTRHSIGELLFDARFGLDRRWGIVRRGFYAERVQVAQALFGTNLLTLVFEEDIVADPASGLRRVCKHLGIEFSSGRFQLFENAKERKPGYSELVVGHYLQFMRPLLRRLPLGPPFRVHVDPATRAKLQEIYSADVKATMRLLGRGTDTWPQVATG